MDLNHWPLGYEPNELPDCSTPRQKYANNNGWGARIRTSECQDQNLVPYRLATPQQTNNKYKIKEALYKSFLKKSS